jgi:hypothetical protein
VAALLTVTGADDESDGGPLSCSTRDKAVAAALEATGGGTVSEAEFADDGGTYSVEVIVDSGRHIEVKLDDSFEVIDQGSDDDGGSNGDWDLGYRRNTRARAGCGYRQQRVGRLTGSGRLWCGCCLLPGGGFWAGAGGLVSAVVSEPGRGVGRRWVGAQRW